MSKRDLSRVLESLTRRLDSLEARTRTTEATEEGVLISALETALNTPRAKVARLVRSAQRLVLATEAPRWRPVFERLAKLGRIDELIALLARAETPVNGELVATLYELSSNSAHLHAFALGMRAAAPQRYETLAALARPRDDDATALPPPPPSHRAVSPPQPPRIRVRTRSLIAEFIRNTYTLDPDMSDVADARTIAAIIADFTRWQTDDFDARRLGLAALRKGLAELPIAYTFENPMGGERLFRVRVPVADSDSEIVNHYSELSFDDDSDTGSLADFIVGEPVPKRKRRRSNPFIDGEAGVS